jgi:hypothetical protein
VSDGLQQPRSPMAPQIDHRVMVLGLLWSALALCGISSLVYDVGRWLSAW